MVAKKRKSKRQTLQQKFRIIKNVREHKKKLKKGVLTNGQLSRIKAKRNRAENNTIPNAWPYKEDLLKELNEAKEKMEAQRQRQKDKRAEEMMKRRMQNSSMEVEEGGNSNTASAAGARNAQLIANALENVNNKEDVSDDENEKEDAIDNEPKNLGQNSRRAFLRELRKVVERADVILQVLDARDPNGTKSSAVEEMVLSNYRKKFVYVLNKADLVPKEVLEGWLKFLRQSHPAIAFKSNTQSQKDRLGSSKGKVTKDDNIASTSQAVGGEELLNLLKNYCRVGDSKSIISVGVVGFPNVGKSSLINSLMRTRAVGVSSVPGFTKASQEVILDRNIRLIDSPGVVFADGSSAATALRNCVNVESLVDVFTPVQAILDKCPQQYLMQVYSIPRYKDKDVTAFLALVAKVTGKLKKGGVPNVDAAARTVLHDWNDGKIKFYCRPPVVKKSKKNKDKNEEDTQLIPHYSKELDLNTLQDLDVKILQNIHSAVVEEKAYNVAEGEVDDYYVGIDDLGDSMEM